MWQTVKQSSSQSYPLPRLWPFWTPGCLWHWENHKVAWTGWAGQAEMYFGEMVARGSVNPHSSTQCLKHRDSRFSNWWLENMENNTNDKMTLQPYLWFHFPPHPKVDSNWGKTVCPEAGQKGSKWGVVKTKEKGVGALKMNFAYFTVAWGRRGQKGPYHVNEGTGQTFPHWHSLITFLSKY